MKAKNISMQEAFNESGKLYNENMEKFKNLEVLLRGIFNFCQVEKIITFFKNFIAGDLEWMMTSKRYSDEEKTLKETGKVNIVLKSLK